MISFTSLLIGLEAEWAWAPEYVWTLLWRGKSYDIGSRTRAVQPVAHRYTDLGTPTIAGNQFFPELLNWQLPHVTAWPVMNMTQ
jgi:hypothetical protein